MIMNQAAQWIPGISTTCTAITAILAVYIYIRQQRISRVQNIIAVFQRFANGRNFVDIFNHSDIAYSRKNTRDGADSLEQLKNIDSGNKYEYLALLSEIVFLSDNSAIIRIHAMKLFKFHFYYAYCDKEVSNAFWSNIGSGVDEKDKEGWNYQKSFAEKCRAEIER